MTKPRVPKQYSPKPISRVLQDNESPTVAQLILTDSAHLALEKARVSNPESVVVLVMSGDGTWRVITNRCRDTTFTLLSKAASVVLDSVSGPGDPDDENDYGIDVIE